MAHRKRPLEVVVDDRARAALAAPFEPAAALPRRPARVDPATMPSMAELGIKAVPNPATGVRHERMHAPAPGTEPKANQAQTASQTGSAIRRGGLV